MKSIILHIILSLLWLASAQAQHGLLSLTIIDESNGTAIADVEAILFEGSDFVSGMHADKNGIVQLAFLKKGAYQLRLIVAGYYTQWHILELNQAEPKELGAIALEAIPKPAVSYLTPSFDITDSGRTQYFNREDIRHNAAWRR